MRFNVDRAKVRYFVMTAELGCYAHALAFWSSGKGGMARILGSAAAAEQRAQESSGVHFSFEKLDKVTRTTVRGRFQTISEEAHHRSELVSFAVSEEALAEAHAATSGGEHHPIEEVEQQLMQEQASVEASAAAIAAAREQSRAAMAERAIRREQERERRLV